MLLTLLAFFFVLLVLVIVHEWGHFFAAKKTGMVVEEFGFGFPPRAVSIKRNGTRYSFNWLPLGGFVKIQGENGDDDRAGSFSTKSIPQRFIVLAAGCIMNMLLAWVLLSISLAAGTPQPLGNANQDAIKENQRVVIGLVSAGSPAEAAGFKSGDVVLKINDEQISTFQTFQEQTRTQAGKNVKYTVRRSGEVKILDVVPRQNPPAGQGMIGVQLAEWADVSYPWYISIWKGGVLTWDFFKMTLDGFGQIIGQLFGGPKVAGEVAGPIGIAVLTGKFAKMGMAALLQFTALLSINLAIINALPIPALDGGRIVFILVEAVRGRRVRAKVEQWSHAIGFALLLALMVVVTIKDLRNLF